LTVLLRCRVAVTATTIIFTCVRLRRHDSTAEFHQEENVGIRRNCNKEKMKSNGGAFSVEVKKSSIRVVSTAAPDVYNSNTLTVGTLVEQYLQLLND